VSSEVCTVVCLLQALHRRSIIPEEKGDESNVAVMNALQHYLKAVEKMGDEKGVLTEKKTVQGIISRIESMPAGEVQ